MKAAVLLGLLCLMSSAAPTRAIAATADTPEAKRQCSVAAMTNYAKATLEFLQQVAKEFYPTVEMQVLQRRMQEQFCLEFVKCNFPDTSSQPAATEYLIAFDKCLREEAK